MSVVGRSFTTGETPYLQYVMACTKLTTGHGQTRGRSLTRFDHMVSLVDYNVWLFVVVQGITFCRGQYIDNVTTHEQMNRTNDPVIFQLGRDPGERHPMEWEPLMLKYLQDLTGLYSDEIRSTLKWWRISPLSWRSMSNYWWRGNPNSIGVMSQLW